MATTESAADVVLSPGASDDSVARDRLRQQIITIASMYVGYALFMVLRMIPSVAEAAIRRDPTLGMDVEVWGRILAVGGCGAVVGKMICGYSADKFGGKLTFTIGLLLASLFVGLFGFASNIWLFGAAYFLALMAKSAGWPSMARIIINWCKPDQYGRVWGILSTSSRVGTLAATFGLASLLIWMSWREMLWIAAGLGIVTAIAFAFLLKERPAATSTAADDTGQALKKSPHPLDGTTLFKAIPRIVESRQFWLITGSLMGLGILWDFLLMVPLFLQDTLHLSESDASWAASAFPLGSLISVLVGGYVFDKLSRGATAWVMGLLLAIATGCLWRS
jgi:sugar phosphate permease